MTESHSPEDCRARAERCENLASQTTFPSARQTFLDLAARWRALAAQQEFHDARQAASAE